MKILLLVFGAIFLIGGFGILGGGFSLIFALIGAAMIWLYILSEKEKAQKTEVIEETHNVAGITYHEDAIMALAEENPDYKMTKREIIDCCMEDERIYQYIFDPRVVDLVDDPSNKYDKSAIKVIIDNQHVGYIKKGSTGRIHNLQKSNSIQKIRAEIYGGKYKIVRTIEDDEGNERYNMKNDGSNIGIRLIFTLSEL